MNIHSHYNPGKRPVKPGRFEKIHLHTLVEIQDESLKKLFKRLAGEDRDHLNRLARLLELIK